MSIRFVWWTVWGTNGAGETIERHIFAENSFSAKHKFFSQTGIVADGAAEE